MKLKYKCKAWLVRLFKPLVYAILFENPQIWGDEKRVQIGKLADITNALLNTQSGKITIGDYSFCGHQVMILTGTHDYHKYNKERMTAIPEEGGDITIGEGVWISSGVTILGPCTIGDHAVIAAGSVVTPHTNIPPKTLFLGSPARFVKNIEDS